MNEFNDIIEDNEIIMESLVNDVENMEIAAEGFIENIKETIKKVLISILNKMESLLAKGDDELSGFRKKILLIVENAKDALTEVKSATTTDEVNTVKEKTEEIKKNCEKVHTSVLKQMRANRKKRMRK